MKWLINFFKKLKAPSSPKGLSPDEVTTRTLSAPKTTPIPPDTEAEPIPFEVEHDRLAKEVVRLKFQLERVRNEVGQNEDKTTELQHSDSIDETVTKKVIQPEDEKRSKALPPAASNEPDAVASLSDFRVVYDANNILEIEVSYTYDGSFGNEGCYVYAAPLKSDGMPIGGSTQSLGDIRPTMRKAKTRTRYEQNWLPDEPLETSQIQLTMQRGGQRPFYYEVFPYVKVWMPAKPAEPKTEPTEPPKKFPHGDINAGIRSTPSESPDPNRPVYPPHFFPTGPGNLWTEYTQDVFHDVIWRWHYKPEIDDTPRDIKPYCPECETPNLLRCTVNRHLQGAWYTVDLECRVHQQSYCIRLDHNPQNRPFESIKKQIQQKLEDGSWLEVVNKQRMLRHEAPLSPSILVPRRLDEIKEEILLILWEHNGSCDIGTLNDALDFLRFKKKEALSNGVPFDEETVKVSRSMLDYHLHDLCEKGQGYVKKVNLRSPQRDGYEITQKGREYIVKNNLAYPAAPPDGI